MEFFLFPLDKEGNPVVDPDIQGGYFDLCPGDAGEEVRREIVLALKAMGFEIDGSHRENSPGQHEIILHHDDILRASDTIVTFRAVAKKVASMHNLHATFMPKLLYGYNGSGMHLPLITR